MCLIPYDIEPQENTFTVQINSGGMNGPDGDSDSNTLRWIESEKIDSHILGTANKLSQLGTSLTAPVDGGGGGRLESDGDVLWGHPVNSWG